MTNNLWDERECLIIRPGGKIIERRLVNNKEKENIQEEIDDIKKHGVQFTEIKDIQQMLEEMSDPPLREFIEKNVTNKAITKLFNNCFIDEGVTLKDIFMILKTELDIFDIIFGNWTKEIVEDFFNNLDKAKIYNPDPNQGTEKIAYLELQQHIAIDEFGIFGLDFPQFDGVSFPAPEDYKPKHGGYYKKGETCGWGIEFKPPYEMANFPLRLNHEVEMVRNYNKIEKFPYHEFTLKDILYGILWELSYLGSPENRNDKKELVNVLVEQIEDVN